MSQDGGLRRIFRKYMPQVHWTSIESRYTQAGIPDLNGCRNGDFWIECKQTKGWKVDIRPMQSAWISRHIRNGARCYVAVRRKNKDVDELWIFQRAIKSLKESKPLGHWGDGPKRWDWEEITARLNAK